MGEIGRWCRRLLNKGVVPYIQPTSKRNTRKQTGLPRPARKQGRDSKTGSDSRVVSCFFLGFRNGPD